MKYYELDKEEDKILEAYNKGRLKSVPNLKKEIERMHEYAKLALDKNKNVNIRISEADLLKVKAMAVRKGIPYQTLLTSLIHQYSTDQIKDRII
jgi:predicted DNA binding CopG/RHH family protein